MDPTAPANIEARVLRSLPAETGRRSLRPVGLLLQEREAASIDLVEESRDGRAWLAGPQIGSLEAGSVPLQPRQSPGPGRLAATPVGDAQDIAGALADSLPNLKVNPL
jgi:hypothetical protein